MSVEAAGILVYRYEKERLEVLLVHPAGPIYGHKDIWSIPKGELDEDEEHLKAAFREFYEEVGVHPPTDGLLSLGSTTQSSGKVNYIWAVEGNVDLTRFASNTFTMEWPPKSGQMQEFPENDRAQWFPLDIAIRKVFPTQKEFFKRLAAILQSRQ